MVKSKIRKQRTGVSYYAEYWSTDGKTLIGGVLRSQSCRYQDPLEAQHRLDQVLALHPGRCKGQVKESPRYPEIFRHCGSASLPAQAIGGHCFACKKVLTVKDAKAAQRAEEA